MKLLYNQTIVKACQIDYEDGPIDPKHTLIHTRAWHFKNLQENLKHDAVICMSMGDEGLEYINNKYYIGTWIQPVYQFDQFNPHIKKLFCPHAALKEDFIEGVPCGVMFNEDLINFGNLNQVSEEKIPKTKLLYGIFNPTTHPDRPHIQNLFRSKSWATVGMDQDNLSYFRRMKQHKFVACPRGNGPDCYRTWEALYMGCIPVVPSEKIGGCHHYFRGKLPILEVDNWNFSPQYLEHIWGEYSKKDWCWDMLEEEYWIKYIQKTHENLHLSGG